MSREQASEATPTGHSRSEQAGKLAEEFLKLRPRAKYPSAPRAGRDALCTRRQTKTIYTATPRCAFRRLTRRASLSPSAHDEDRDFRMR